MDCQIYSQEGQDAFTKTRSLLLVESDQRVFKWVAGAASESGICASLVTCISAYLQILNPKFI